MADTKRHRISFVTRMLIIFAFAVSVSVVTTILLIQKHGATWNILVPVVILAVVVPATLGVAVNYPYWRPRYRML